VHERIAKEDKAIRQHDAQKTKHDAIVGED
jgi:hypothetical protein